MFKAFNFWVLHVQHDRIISPFIPIISHDFSTFPTTLASNTGYTIPFLVREFGLRSKFSMFWLFFFHHSSSLSINSLVGDEPMFYMITIIYIYIHTSLCIQYTHYTWYTFPRFHTSSIILAVDEQRHAKNSVLKKTKFGPLPIIPICPPYQTSPFFSPAALGSVSSSSFFSLLVVFIAMGCTIGRHGAAMESPHSCHLPMMVVFLGQKWWKSWVIIRPYPLVMSK